MGGFNSRHLPMEKLEHLPVTIGYGVNPGGESDVEIDILLSTLILGKSRTGKSTAMLLAIAGALRAGLSCVVIDPHGSLIEQALHYIPQSRLKDLVLIDPTADKIPGFGFFDAKDVELSAQDFQEIMEVRSGKGWGPETARTFRNTTDATLEFFKRPTVLPIYQMLMREEFAQKILGKSKNPLVQDFYNFWFSKEIKARDRMTAFSHPLNKIDEFLRPGVREILLQRNTVKWEQLLDSRKIVFINLQKAKIGRKPAQIIGNLALMNIVRAAWRRKRPDRKVPVFVDEAHNFLDGIDLELMLAESAKRGVVYHLGDQNLTQMRNEDMKIFNDEIALGNCSSIISFRVSGKDAPRLTEEFGDELEPRHLVRLPNYTFYAWTLSDGSPVLKGQATTYAAPALYNDEVPYESALAWGRENTGTDKAAVEADILKRLNVQIRVKQMKKAKRKKKSGTQSAHPVRASQSR
jgi:DNA helicase HerA-like ATPase